MKALHRFQAGLTIVELMISITLGLLIVMAATALLVSTKSGYSSQDDGSHIQDTGRYAIEVITRAVRQAAYENWDAAEAPIVATDSFNANINGLDASSLKKGSVGIDFPLTTSMNGSDVLAVRFFGTGDGMVVNCAGVEVFAPSSKDSADADRGWSIFYVAEDVTGEPALYCKYRGKNGNWSSDAIASGVESFQVLYGLDTDADGLPNQFVNATEIHALDSKLVIQGSTVAEQTADKNKKTNWKKVVVIKTALLVRGFQNAPQDAEVMQYDLFGKEYADGYAAADAGSRIEKAALPSKVKDKARKIFTSVIQLRNQSAGSGI